MELTETSIKEFFENSKDVLSLYLGTDGYYLINGLTGEIIDIPFENELEALNFMDTFANPEMVKKYHNEWRS